MFIDRAEIYICGGKGGDGCLSFRREKFIPRGGPDGGDGGKGGSVYAIAASGVDTLLDFASRHHWRADNGRPGMGKKMSGRNGEDIDLELPAGTLIYDRGTGVLIKDLTDLAHRVCIAEGGKGGKGNARFARATNQVPRQFETGQLGQERWLRLELKLIADVGIVGLPNAGKSTLLSRVSKAEPKIADYPFTTLRPQLGIVELSGGRRFVMADIPGLIEGAHRGAGLGDEFLRHIERTRTILHVVDVGSEFCEQSPVEAYRTIRRELGEYSPALEAKEELVVGNKTDLPSATEALEELSAEVGGQVLAISAATGEGLSALMEKLWSAVEREKRPETAPVAPSLPVPPHRRT